MKNCAKSIKSAFFAPAITTGVSLLATLSLCACSVDIAYANSEGYEQMAKDKGYILTELSFDKGITDKLYISDKKSNNIEYESSLNECKVTGVPKGWFEKYYADKAEEARIAELEAQRTSRASKSSSSSSYYSSGGSGVLTKSGGVNQFNGRRETWYSQRVLPGGGLNIPGRHVEPSDGTVRDGEGYICVAASDLPRGTVVETSLGTGKVYDTGCAAGTTDVYVDW